MLCVCVCVCARVPLNLPHTNQTLLSTVQKTCVCVCLSVFAIVCIERGNYCTVGQDIECMCCGWAVHVPNERYDTEFTMENVQKNKYFNQFGSFNLI